MHFLTSLIIFVGFGFVVCVGLVRVMWELSELSFHESPVIREARGEFAAAEDAKAAESYESSPTELGENDDGSVRVEYDLASSVLGQFGNPDILQIATQLDEKIKGLLDANDDGECIHKRASWISRSEDWRNMGHEDL